MDLLPHNATNKQIQQGQFPELVFSEAYQHLFENMLHGFAYCKVIFDENRQVQDFEYVYVNKTYGAFGLSGLPGKTALELVPGMRQQLPLLFEAIQRVMDSGTSEMFENFIPALNKWFSVSVYSPQPGYFAAFLDNITAQKESEAKIRKLNRLYAFISQINQAILYTKNEEELFRKTCQIAFESGVFEMSWIGQIDGKNKKIRMLEEFGMPVEDRELFRYAYYQTGGPQDHVVRTGTSFICNHIENDFLLGSWKPYAEVRGINACMVLPLKKNGVVYATFNLYSSLPYFFDTEEVKLLEEAAGDVSFALDVFEKENTRQQIEKQIKESEANHKAIFENTSEAFVLLDNNDCIKAFNEKARKQILTNAEKEVIIGENIFEYVEEERHELLGDILAKVKKGETVLYERSYTIKNTEVWFHFSMAPVREHDVIRGICITARDITEKKRTQQQREFERNNLNSLINNTNDLMWSVDRNFRLITSNLAFDEMLKHLSGKPIKRGTNVLDSSFDKEELQRFKSHYERAFAGETFTEVEQNGTMYSEISYYPIYNNMREIVGTACFSRDITNNKRTEESLKKSEAHLKSANKELETFIYRASHDLRGPLSSIIGLTNVSKMDVQDEKALEYIGMIGSATRKLDDTLVGLVQSLSIKDVTRFEDVIDFKTLINDTLDKFRFYEGFSRITFEEQISLSGPFISSRLILQTVMQNMIENAIKYQNNAAKQSYLRISVSDNESEVILTFEDNGVGIDATVQDKIFDVYYKGTQKSTGSGLGLYIVKTGIERLNGSIQLVSEARKGSVFTFRLPKKRIF